jgi:hypothetical protein
VLHGSGVGAADGAASTFGPCSTRFALVADRSIPVQLLTVKINKEIAQQTKNALSSALLELFPNLRFSCSFLEVSLF